MLKDVPGARWEVYRTPKRYKDVMQHRTVLTGMPMGRPTDPGRIVYFAVIGPYPR